MPAPVGNKHAAGGNGGWSYTKEYRELQIRLKQKAMELAAEVIEQGTFKGEPVAKAEQIALMKELVRNAIPKETIVEGGGEGSNPVQIIVKALE